MKALRVDTFGERRSAFPAMLFAAAVTAVLATGGCDASARRSRNVACRNCNVVLVSFDTVRADHVGAYGYERPTTPNIDKLAERGVLFKTAISQSAWTRPAHASMLTGLYPSQHGMVSMSRSMSMPTGVRTLPAVLGENGYATAAFTGGGNMSAHFGFDSGFDRYETLGRRFEESLAAIESWLAEPRSEPFFLMVHGYDAHRPYRSAAKDRAALGLGAEKPSIGMQRVCREGRDPRDAEAHVWEYDAAIRHGDRGIGGLVEILERSGHLEDTVIVVTSDHGEEFLEHGGCFHVRTLYREVVAVPLIVVVPGFSSRVVEEIVPASVAVAPTILDLVGVSDRELRGPSLASFLDARRKPSFEYVVSETAVRQPNRRVGHIRALTGPNDKLVWWAAEQRYEYFDLRADPMEERPLVFAPRARHLLRHLDLWLSAHPPLDTQRASRPMPPALESDLRALGYVD